MRVRTEPPVVILMGPTGAGKSVLALTLAKKFNGEIISADSRQIYVGMDIGTDKLVSSQQGPHFAKASRGKTENRDKPISVEGVPHYLIDILTPDQRYSAAEFRDDAQRFIVDMHQRGKFPIVVGGTGFYVRVLTGHRSLPNVPPDPAFRAWAEEQPLTALVDELRERAPDLYAQVDNPRNKQRVVRVLEIARGRLGAGGRVSGVGVSNPTPETQHPTPVQFLKLTLLPPADVLHERLTARVEDEFRRGFVDEVRRLVTQYGESAPGLQAVGYRQVLPYLRNERTLDETQQAVLRAHRDYARRQLTWLKKEPALVRVTSPSEAHRAITAFLQVKKAGSTRFNRHHSPLPLL